MIIHNFDLNMIPDSEPVIVHVDQYDEGTGKLVATLYNGDSVYSTSGTAVIQGTKPDGHGFQYPATLSGSTVTANLTKQMTAAAGNVRTQFVITETGGRTGTFCFTLAVQKSGLPADTDMSTSAYQLVEQMIDTAEQSATDSANYALDAEAYAKGTRNGSAVSSSDPAYHNNALYYAGQASENGEAWAVGTRNGEQIPSTDPAYNNHARYWAGQAEQYAQGGLMYKGSVAFASIPTTGMKVGDMYNITDDFTTDSRFEEGSGISVKAGTNIAYNSNGKWDCMAVGGSDTVDLTSDVTGTLPIDNGGTGSTTASGARSNLGLGSLATKSSVSLTSDVSGTLPIDNGGTGATSASGARSNLGLGSLATKSSVSLTSNVTGILPVANGGTGNSDGYIRTGKKSGTTIGNYATAEGYQTTASDYCSHAEGYNTTASGSYSHAEGYNTTASGSYSHAEGYYTTASDYYSHAEGNYTTASGSYSHAEGCNTTASDYYSHAEGCNTTARVNQHVQGHVNTEYDGGLSGTSGTAMIIGNGTNYSKSNAFRVTYAGGVYGLSAYNSSGADYAEFFEWADKNINNEDRVGCFVTLDGEKIKLAQKGDYILGVVSGQPSVVGNGDEDWLGRWQRDDFGRFIWGDMETPEDKENPIHTILPNPDYDPSQKYIERKDRPEWDYVGMLGNIAVRDDGTCEVNGYCTVANGGVATKAKTGYRVIKRVSDNVIKIIIK